MITPLEAKTRSPMTRFLPGAVVIVAMAAFWLLDLQRFISLQAVVDNRDDLARFIADHGAAALIVFGVIYAAAVAVSFPGASFMTIAAGFLFGTVTGASVVVVAATIGACLVFLAARTSIGEPLARRAGPFLSKLRAGFRSNAFTYLLALRLAPIFPFWLVNLAPALLGVDLRTFAIATGLGIIPGSLAFSAIGGGLDSVIAAQKAVYDQCVASGAADCQLTVDPSALVTPHLLLALGGLALFAFLPAVLKAIRAKTFIPDDRPAE